MNKRFLRVSLSCALLATAVLSGCGGGSLGTGIRPFDAKKLPERKIELPWFGGEDNPCDERQGESPDRQGKREKCRTFLKEKS